MPLSPSEQAAARRATYFSPYGYGRISQGLCPIGMVLRERGVRFRSDHDGWLLPQCDVNVMDQALTDMCDWLGIQPTISLTRRGVYSIVLEKDGPRMFERAP